MVFGLFLVGDAPVSSALGIACLRCWDKNGYSYKMQSVLGVELLGVRKTKRNDIGKETAQRIVDM